MRARDFILDAAIVLAAVVVRAATPSAAWIEAHYANGAYPDIDRVVRAVTGPMPFCVGDVLFVLALVLLVRFWVLAVRHARGRLAWTSLHVTTRTLAVACAIYVWFMVSWAYGYSRVPLAQKIPVHADRANERAVDRFADRVVDALTRYALAAHRERASDGDVGARLEPTFEATIRRLGDRASFAPPRIKPTMFQPLFAASATTGFTDPWTHEVSLEGSLFPVERPAIYAHEWSHISGFNDEAEANFIAAIACTTSHDPLLEYSGWLLVWENLPPNVHVTHHIGRTAYADLIAIRARYVKNVNPQVERASRAAYDHYLKSNHVSAGVASYGLFVRWLVGADFDRSGLPIVREEAVDARADEATSGYDAREGERTVQTTLQTRRLGTTDLDITPVGFGAWAIGGGDWKFGWGDQDDAQSIAAIRRALELGVNWIDTAAVYGFGRSEEVVAKALEGISERPYIFTKCGLLPNAANDGGTVENISRASIEKECEASLRRLRVDTIDLYQIHWPTDDIADIDEAWEAMESLRASGKVRAIGVSNFNVDEIKRAEKTAPVASLQPPYSLVKRRVESDILPYCAQQNIGVIVYSPMQSGLLTGKMTRERIASLPANDWRSQSGDFKEPKLTKNLELVERLRAVGERHGKSPGEVAIAWTLRDPVVTGAIVGGRSPEQVDGVVGAAAFRLTPEEIAEVEG